MTGAIFRNPPELPSTRGYTHVVETSGPGRTIYISGQLGMTRAGAFGGDDFHTQAIQCFENLKAALHAAGAGFEHVVKITSYFINMSDLATFFKVRDMYVNTAAPPASTAVQVAKLALPQALFEIEAVAVVPQG